MSSVDRIGCQSVFFESVPERSLLCRHGLLLHLPPAGVPQPGRYPLHAQYVRRVARHHTLVYLLTHTPGYLHLVLPTTQYEGGKTRVMFVMFNFYFMRPHLLRWKKKTCICHLSIYQTGNPTSGDPDTHHSHQLVPGRSVSQINLLQPGTRIIKIGLHLLSKSCPEVDYLQGLSLDKN